MITYFCGDCGDGCDADVERNERGEPVLVTSSCCGGNVCRDPLLIGRVDEFDFDVKYGDY